MPQSERSQNMKEILRWLKDVVGEDGVTVGQIVAYVVNEVTELGATEKTAKGYVERLHKASLIDFVSPNSSKFRITKAGRKWLERHSI